VLDSTSPLGRSQSTVPSVGINGSAGKTSLHERAALDLLDAGYWPVVLMAPTEPGSHDGKRPVGKAWAGARPTPGGVIAAYMDHPGRGVGLALGPGRGPGGSWLVDIEGDGPDAEEARVRLLGGELIETAGWSSPRGRHQLFVVADPDRMGRIVERIGGAAVVHFKKNEELPDLELRGLADGQIQSACPPTAGRVWNGHDLADLPEAAYQALEGLADAREAKARARREAARNGGPARPAGDVQGRVFDAAAKAARSAKGGTAEGGRNHGLYHVARIACSDFLLGRDDTERIVRDYAASCRPPYENEGAIMRAVDKAIAEGNFEPCEAYLHIVNGRRRPAREAANGHHVAPTNGHPADVQESGTSPAITPPEPQESDAFRRTDVGNGLRFKARHGADCRFIYPWNTWIVWDGKRWAAESRAEVERRAQETARSVYREAADASDSAEAKALGRWAETSERREKLSAMLATAQSMLDIEPDRLDADPWAFNCRNGTLDLRTGELRPHRREDLLTVIADVDYSPTARAPRWEEFLATTFEGSDDVIGYIRRLAGYFLTGVVREHILPIAHGVGANGKSTLLNALLDVLGPYGMKAPADLLMLKRHAGHPTELADLRGKRLVVAAETAEDGRLNEALVKELTGGDVIRARRMREDFWEFRPTHKVVVGTNHRPTVTGNDLGIWRRLQLIPFDVVIPPDERDATLPDRLRAEAGGILAWAVRGCLEWQEAGLNPPGIITVATEEYRSTEDTIANFFTEGCVILPEARVRSSDLYAKYVEWCELGRFRPRNQRRFGEALTSRGFERFTNNGTWYRGIGLRQEC
jgi:P4 family phage/plasmid primase-like protien